MRTDFPDPDYYATDFPRSQTAVYKEEAIIGNGAYGTVYKARDINNPSDYVALKKVRIPLNEDGVPVSILREISLIRQLDKFQHPNIVRFLDVCHGPRHGGESNFTLFLVFEYVERDLAKFIQITPKDELTSKIKNILFQILCGVDFLHSQRIIHRDLKPQNLLISRSGQVKLADFGLAKIYDFTMRLTSVVVTLWYRSPEVLLGSSYGSPLDLWAVGCIFAELYRRKALFPGESERDQLEKIFDVIGTPSDEEWPSEARVLPQSFTPRICRNWDLVVPGICPLGKDLLSRLLVFNPRDRITAKDALQHAFFEGLSVPPIEFRKTLSPSSEPSQPHRDQEVHLPKLARIFQ
ncbi:unnamed protein product [Allacma fusca]|uniref:cyclin-dependent kinase n=1 Tax=Allacma fusca TaxID=39272 RepID=A0A8J2K206_9HEXA|nr:unnamed protein product [Allacma fusca]